MRSDEDRFRERVIHLSRAHGAVVHAVARRYAHTSADVEDLVQDVWVRVVEILPHKNPASSDEGWLCVVAANVGHEFLMKKKRLGRLKGALAFLFPSDAPSTPALQSIGDAPTARIWAAIDALPGLQRQVVLHRVFEGLSTEETAKAINRAEGTVKASLHRALKTLSVELADLESLWSSSDL